MTPLQWSKNFPNESGIYLVSMTPGYGSNKEWIFLTEVDPFFKEFYNGEGMELSWSNLTDEDRDKYKFAKIDLPSTARLTFIEAAR